MSPDQPALPTTTLAAQFGFSLDELAQNRAGTLSARQQQDVFYRSWGYLARGVVLLVVGIGVALWLAPSAEGTFHYALLAGVALLLGINAAIFLADLYRVVRPTVHGVTGPLRRGDDAWRPSVFVGGTELFVNSRRWRRLEARYPGVYRAYYTPASHLLSIEPIGGEPLGSERFGGDPANRDDANTEATP
jgi:hypothetical protein